MPFTVTPLKSSDTVISEINKMSEKLITDGVIAISYHLTPPNYSQVSKLATVFHFGYAPDVIGQYLDPEVFENDPIPDHVMRAGHAMSWVQAVAEQKLSRGQKQFFKAFNSFPYLDGVAVPLFGPSGMNSYLSLVFKAHVVKIDEAYIESLVKTAQHFHGRICRIRNDARVFPNPLSSRESDVLFWISRGKSNHDIAIILDVTESSVDTYVRRIFKKLNVHDRMSAVLSLLSYSTFKP